MKRLIQTLCILFSLPVFVLLPILVPMTFAQSTPRSQVLDDAASLGVAKVIELKNKDVQDGSILSSSTGGAVLSNTPYDSQVIGVVARDAAIILSNSADKDGVPVIASGTVYVLVSTKEGAIKKGDLITTSTIPGVGVKAVKGGYVLGTALEDYDSTNPNQSEKIVVDFNLHYFNTKPTLAGSLTDVLKLAIMPTKDGPSALYKYMLAAGVVLGSFVLSFLTFGRTAAKGVEALGRNPAASKIIHLGIIFNVIICFMIIASGMTIAFLILRL